MGSKDRKASPTDAGSDVEVGTQFETLKKILGTSFGNPAPASEYKRKPTEELRTQLEAELSSAERAHAVAAARLHSLYAD
jgi:hypothetical protein